MARIEVDLSTPIEIPDYTPPSPGRYRFQIVEASIWTKEETGWKAVSWLLKAVEAEDPENASSVGNQIRHLTGFYAPQEFCDRKTMERRAKDPDAKPYDPRAMLMGFLVDIGAGSKDEGGKFVDSKGLFGPDGSMDLAQLIGHEFTAAVVETKGEGGKTYTNLKRIKALS